MKTLAVSALFAMGGSAIAAHVSRDPGWWILFAVAFIYLLCREGFTE